MLGLLIIVMLINGCGDKEKKVMGEQREYVSTSLYKDLLENNIVSINDKEFSVDLYHYIDKNKGKYVRWLIETTSIDKDGKVVYMLTPEGNGTYIKCDFSYNYGDSIKDGTKFIVSGKIKDFSTWSDILTLTECRIEKNNDEELKQLEVDKSVYYEKIKNNKDGDFKSEGKIETSVILGSTRDKIVKIFSDYEIDNEYVKNVDVNAIKFTNENQQVVVDFDSNGIAEGVSFESSNTTGDGKNSYVNKHYDELLKLATGGKEVKVEKNVTSKYPISIYIGNVHN